jgi:23S rRNA pseudouridine1911/1915/1917 synthase
MDKNNSVQENSNFSIQVTDIHAGLRIDSFLAMQLPVFSRSLIKKLLTNKQVLVNRLQTAKPSYIIKSNDIITLLSIPTPAARSVKKVSVDIGVTIIADHDDFLIINKPAGLVVHPPEQTFTDIALTDWLVQEFPEIGDIGDPLRPGIVHRLDRNTSGLMIVAKTNFAYQQFVQMFKDRLIHKTYIALVQGHPVQSGTIDFAIGRHPVQKNIMHAFTAIPENSCARDAITDFKVLQYFDTYSLLELKPKTGRTHQIRVHCKAIGHPLLGDTVYGTASKKIAYHALHAHNLQFTFHGIVYDFTSPLDPVLQKIVDASVKI